MLLGRIVIPDQIAEPIQVDKGDGKGNASSHAADSHATRPTGIRPGIQMSDAIHSHVRRFKVQA
jgi:hypothetical protein